MLLDGCHEGKHTPRLTEVKCPQCGEWVDVFVLMGGRPGQTGTLASDEKCDCGYVLRAGSLRVIVRGEGLISCLLPVGKVFMCIEKKVIL